MIILLFQTHAGINQRWRRMVWFWREMC